MFKFNFEPLYVVVISTIVLTWLNFASASTNRGWYDSHRNLHNHSYPSFIHKKHYRKPHHYSLAYAWKLISTNRSHTALKMFGHIARSRPYDGTPKIGYAIAAADIGKYSTGVWAMRRALKYDPHALRYLSLDTRITGKIYYLTEQYLNYGHSLPNQGAQFMLAALYYLTGEREACLEAVQKMKEKGDYSVSAKNLYKLVAQDF